MISINVDGTVTVHTNKQLNSIHKHYTIVFPEDY